MRRAVFRASSLLTRMISSWAFVFLLFAPLPLLVHLGHPERAFNIMVTPNPSSAMAGFGLAYNWYLMILVLEVWFVFRKDIVMTARQSRGVKRFIFSLLALRTYDISEEALKTDHKIVTVLAAIGIPSACFLHGYVGFLFGAIKANPWWSTPLMPVIFLFSAVVSGIAAMILMYQGATEFTRMLSFAHSAARPRLSWMIAAFVIAYGVPVPRLVSPATEVMFTMLPPPAFFMRG